MKQIVIVQPYIPAYRVEFFERLQKRLFERGVQITVAAGSPTGSQLLRRDKESLDFELPIKLRKIKVAGRSINLGGSAPAWMKADGVILGLEGTSLDLIRAVVRRSYTNLKLGVWGHVNSYVKRGNSLDLALERWQMRHADHVFAYTKSGADTALRAGVLSSKVTALNNSVNTDSLELARDEISENLQDTGAFLDKHGLRDVRLLGYIGGLDSSKRIDFLAASLDLLWISAPNVKLLVAGHGTEEALLAPAVERGQAILLGYADDKLKAQIGQVVDAFVMPGRVGLVAVDTLLLHKPLLTTDWPFHSAELEYLNEGITKFTSRDNVHAFADLMSQGQRLNLLHSSPSSARFEWTYPRLDDMVENFKKGVLSMLEEK